MLPRVWFSAERANNVWTEPEANDTAAASWTMLLSGPGSLRQEAGLKRIGLLCLPQ
jgi:hypothetical protein